MALKGLKQKYDDKKQNKKQTKKKKNQRNGKYKIRQLITKTKEHTHTKPKHSKEYKINESDPVSKETKNDVDQLKTKLAKTQTRRQDQLRVPTGK